MIIELNKLNVREIKPDEIEIAAKLLAKAYYDDVFFKWCVPNDGERFEKTKAYYAIYLKARGSVAHIAESLEGEIIGATVWLPHDADAQIYDEIEQAVGDDYLQFREVAKRSHANEPKAVPFYQLVGFGVLKEWQGQKVGQTLLAYQLDILDKMGIPTYLEASTPYNGGGVYGKFGYKYFGEIMEFADGANGAKLYPLFRGAVE